MKALTKLDGVRSPLLEAGLTKAEIRTLSRERGLFTWNKPAKACLASRIPYGEPVTREGLARVEAAERFLAGILSLRMYSSATIFSTTRYKKILSV